MPIACPAPIRLLYPDDFARLDERVMRHVFAARETLGRLCEPAIYRNDVAARLAAAGLENVRPQVPITLTHRDFARTCWLDLVVNDSAVYQFETASRLTVEHNTRLLTALLLYGAQQGKLVNFRPPELETRLVHTALTPQARRELGADIRHWQEEDSATELVRSTVVELLEDWGGFLDPSLYREALTHLLGGEEKLARSVEVRRDGVLLGHQPMCLVAPDTAFHFTATDHEHDQYQSQLEALLDHTSLKTILWVNLAGHRIQFVMLLK